MKIYLVGGAVRDELLGLPIHERDYVVVGATVAEMLALDFLQVGKDFPVFLHPKTKEEYALARSERKQGTGYHGFICNTENISLEDDLLRRDLTINAIAKGENGEIIDPYHGQVDLQKRILRHVSPAFAEDPVRVLRIARFMAKYHQYGFKIADETLVLMQNMVAKGEINHLVAERVQAEMLKALAIDNPEQFFLTLRDCGALAVLMPEINNLFGVPQKAEYHPEIDTGVHVMMCLADAGKRKTSLLTRFAVLCHDLGKATTPVEILPSHHGHEQRGVTIAKAFTKRFKFAKDFQQMAVKSAEFHTHVHRIFELKASTILKLFKQFNALKPNTLFDQFVDACISDCRGRLGFENADYPQAAYVLLLRDQLKKLDTQQFIKEGMSGEQIKEAIYRGQLAFLKSIHQQQ